MRIREIFQGKKFIVFFFSVVGLIIIALSIYVINNYSQDIRSQAAGTNSNKYTLQARVKLNGSDINLNTPLYITDVYTGVWNDPSWALTDFWERPNTNSGDFYVGDYTQIDSGKESVIRAKLQIMKDYQITPTIHIMHRRQIVKKSNGTYVLENWNNYGIKRDGKMYYSYEIFNNFWKPILEDMKIPYLVTIDMWAFTSWAPSGIPANTFYKLWWEEMDYLMSNINQRDNSSGTNMHIKFREYTDNTSAYWPGMVLLHLNTPGLSDCSDLSNNVFYSFMKSAGNPSGTGKNPLTGKWIASNSYFWFVWNNYNSNLKKCVGNNGTWNVVNFNWGLSTNIKNYESENSWIEGMDNLGPRYFYGYFPHFHDKKSSVDGRHVNLSGTSLEKTILTTKASEKGLVFVGYWNEYAETVLEPSILTSGSTEEHNPWVNNRPVRLDNFFKSKMQVSYPSQIVTPIQIDLPDLNPGSIICNSDQYKVNYYNNTTMSGTVVASQSLSELKVTPGIGSPTMGVNADNYSLKAVQMITIPAKASYTFTTYSDDGVRVYLDGKLIIDNWKDQGTTKTSVTKTVNKGTYPLEIQYYEKGGGSYLSFEYVKR